MPDVFWGFDIGPTAVQGSNPTQWASLAKPPSFYHAAGVATLDQTIGQGYPSTAISTGRTGSGGAYGNTPSSSVGSSNRTTMVTGKYLQLAVVRSAYSIGSEVWLQFDCALPYSAGASLASSYEPTSAGCEIFKWGDLRLRCKSTTYIAALSSHTVVFSLHNNGSEIATVTVPGAVSESGQQWAHFKIYAKLDASTGAFTVTINGVAQSAAYTGQNTVNTIALGTATEVYFGPGVFDNATTAYVGLIDNVFISPTAFAAGRPKIERWAPDADDTLTGWAAEGTGPTTVFNAISNYTDAKAARGTGTGSSALIGMAAVTTTGLDTNILGINIQTQKISNRNASAYRGLSVGMSLSAVHTMGTAVAALVPPLDVVSTPPATVFISPVEWSINNAYTISDLASIQLRLLVV